MTPDQAPDRITPGKPLEPQSPVRPQPGTEFQSLMQGAPSRGSGPAQTQPATAAPSPMEVVKPPLQTATPSVGSLLAQSKTTQDSLGVVEDQLKTPNLKFKRSQAHLLRNKLGDANQYIRSAAGKMGLETPPMKTPPQSGALQRFMGYVNSGQDHMAQIQQKLQEMAASDQEMRPGDMMLVQVKMAQAQQEIEYSSTLLSKVIDSIKQILNTQL